MVQGPLSCSTLVRILRGIAQGTPTKHLAEKLGIDRRHTAGAPSRHPSAAGAASFPLTPAVPNPVVEADAWYQHASEQGIRHPDPRDSPRRATTRRGHGTFAHDRPPSAGVVGRASSPIYLPVGQHCDRPTRDAFVTTHTQRATIVNTDEWRA